MPAVARLPHQTFSIPSVGDGPSNDYLHIGALLADLPKLDEARKFMRLKEHEVGALADQLDEIYEAAIKLGRPAATLRVPQEEHTE
jgi:hypothetical protein